MILAGPAVNFALFVICDKLAWLLVNGAGAGVGMAGLDGFASSLWQISSINFMLLWFNLLPSHPLDGGRALVHSRGRQVHGGNVLRIAISAVVAVLLAFVAAEFSLNALGLGSLYQSGVSRLFDPVLLFRLPPNYAPGIDANGYRNPTTEGPFDIVFLGDSHTYGYGVAAADTMPRQVERLTGLKTYSFGMGGFGPAQYAYLADRALELRPRYLVVAVYLANDFVDACVIANRLPYWQERYRAAGMVSPNCGQDGIALVDEPPPSLSTRLKSAIKATRLGSLLIQFAYQPMKAWVAFRLFKSPLPGTLLADDERLFSVFNVWGHDKVHAQEGFLITRRLLGEITAKAASQGGCSVILLLPSKESLLFEYLRERNYAMPPGFESSVMAEREIARMLAESAPQLGATIADARPDLLEAFATRGPLYPPDLDGHPFAKGYAAYAAAVVRSLSPSRCSP